MSEYTKYAEVFHNITSSFTLQSPDIFRLECSHSSLTAFVEVSSRINTGSYWIQLVFLLPVPIFNHKPWGFGGFFQLWHMGRLQLAHRKLSQANSEIANKASLPTCWHTAPEGNISSGSLERFEFLEQDFLLHCFSVCGPGKNSIKSSFICPICTESFSAQMFWPSRLSRQ